MSSNFQLHPLSSSLKLDLKSLSLQTQFNTMPRPCGFYLAVTEKSLVSKLNQTRQAPFGADGLAGMFHIFNHGTWGWEFFSLITIPSPKSQSHTYTEPMVPTGSWPSSATEPYSSTQTWKSGLSIKCLSSHKASLMTSVGAARHSLSSGTMIFLSHSIHCPVTILFCSICASCD